MAALRQHRLSARLVSHSTAVVELRHRVTPYQNLVTAVQHGDRETCSSIVLSLHGFADSASSFDLVAPHLVQGDCCVIAVDLPGHGNSDWTGRYAYIDFAQDVMSFILAAGIDSATTGKPLHVLSHSFGAEISACLACIEPGLFSKLCLIECASFPPGEKYASARTAERAREAYEYYQLQLKKARSQPRVYPTRQEALSHRIKNQVFELSASATGVLCRRCIRRSQRHDGFEFCHDPMLFSVARNHGSTGWTSTPCLDFDQRQHFHSRCEAEILWVKTKYASQLHCEDWKAYTKMKILELGPLAHHIHLESPRVISDAALRFFRSNGME